MAQIQADLHSAMPAPASGIVSGESYERELKLPSLRRNRPLLTHAERCYLGVHVQGVGAHRAETFVTQATTHASVFPVRRRVHRLIVRL
jgi:hypothetical protein